MLKRVLAALLAVCMLSGLLTAAAFAESDYKTGRIAFFKDGTEVSDFAAGDTITAKVKVKSATSTDSLMFMLMLYQDDMLIDMAFDNKPAASSAVEYSAELTIPDNTDNLELTAVLWDNLKDMNAICSSSIFPVTNIDLIELTVNGELLEGFSSDIANYNVPIPGSTTEVPSVAYRAVDNGVKVKITNPELADFPGKSTVEVSNADGSLKQTYTINYLAETVTDITAVDPTANIDYHVYNRKAAVPGFKVFPNYADAGKAEIVSIDPSLEGLDCITSEAGSGMAGNSAWQTQNDWISFKLERDANVILLQQDGRLGPLPDFLVKDGWVKEDGKTFMKLTEPFSTEFSVKYEKSFKAGSTVTMPALGSSSGYESQDGMFLLIRYDNESYTSAPVNEDADLEF